MRILFCLFGIVFVLNGFGQSRVDSNAVHRVVKDTILRRADSTGIVQGIVKPTNTGTQEKDILADNKYLNWKAAPVSLVSHPTSIQGKEYIFYIICALLLLLGILKVFYNRYFHNVFRVFFNTSLRQSQLTDMLIQARLPSLIFNIFFIITGGLYITGLVEFFNLAKPSDYWILALVSTSCLALIYIVKFIGLRFIGWLSGMGTAADTYIFVIFLINKILGILLLPIVILIAFSTPDIVTYAILISIFMICILFLLRYLRSYGLLHNQLSVTPMHFLLYVVAVEILPVILVSKIFLNYVLTRL